MTLFETKLGPEALFYIKPRIISNNKLDKNLYTINYKYNINLLYANNLELDKNNYIFEKKIKKH